MSEKIVVDTGPLVAIANPDDEQHEACVLELKALTPPLHTTWAVLTEVTYMLRSRLGSVTELLRRLEAGAMICHDLPQESSTWFIKFFEQYRDHEPQLADASLVYVAEKEGIGTVFTLDRRDFSIYRTASGKALRIIPE